MSIVVKPRKFVPMKLNDFTVFLSNIEMHFSYKFWWFWYIVTVWTMEVCLEPELSQFACSFLYQVTGFWAACMNHLETRVIAAVCLIHQLYLTVFPVAAQIFVWKPNQSLYIANICSSSDSFLGKKMKKFFFSKWLTFNG